MKDKRLKKRAFSALLAAIVAVTLLPVPADRYPLAAKGLRVCCGRERIEKSSNGGMT